MALAAPPARRIRFQLPLELECDDYRMYNPDLSGFSDEALVEHYNTRGLAEGRRANSIASRNHFAGLIPQNADSLEIGPFHNPLLRGRRTKYFDVLTRETLVERAASLEIPGEHVPEIDFVSNTGDLTIIDKDFDFVLSSHCLEHQPDLVTHLRNVERILRPDGRFFLLVPDRRFCFDHFIEDSTIADVLQAYEERRQFHTVKSVVEHRALTTHNDCVAHWTGNHGIFMEEYETRVAAALEEYHSAKGSYIDVHAWYFTPTNIRLILAALKSLGLTRFEIDRLYSTRFCANEFWMVLRTQNSV